MEFPYNFNMIKNKHTKKDVLEDLSVKQPYDVGILHREVVYALHKPDDIVREQAKPTEDANNCLGRKLVIAIWGNVYHG